MCHRVEGQRSDNKHESVTHPTGEQRGWARVVVDLISKRFLRIKNFVPFVDRKYQDDLHGS